MGKAARALAFGCQPLLLTDGAEITRETTLSEVLGESPACVTNTSESSWCCTKDGSRPPEVGLQEQASNYPVLLRSKDVVVND